MCQTMIALPFSSYRMNFRIGFGGSLRKVRIRRKHHLLKVWEALHKQFEGVLQSVSRSQVDSSHEYPSPFREQRNRRAVRAATPIFRSRIPEAWWHCDMECCCYLLHVRKYVAYICLTDLSSRSEQKSATTPRLPKTSHGRKEDVTWTVHRL